MSELDDAAEPLVARQLVDQLLVAEPTQPQQLVERRDGVVGVTQAPEVARGPQRGRDAQWPDQLDVARAARCRSPLAQTPLRSRRPFVRWKIVTGGTSPGRPGASTIPAPCSQPADSSVTTASGGTTSDSACRRRASESRVGAATYTEAISLRTAPRSTIVLRRERDTPAVMAWPNVNGVVGANGQSAGSGGKTSGM